MNPLPIPTEPPPGPRQSLPLHRSLLAIAALSAGAVLLALGGSLLTRRALHLYLVWNLFLALVPLVPAVAVHRILPAGGWRRAWLPAALWLLFLPNAPYILTDFIHLHRTAPQWLWGHLILLVWFSGAGLLSGLVSLRIVHQALATRHRPAAAWLAIAGISLLAGLGVGIGRFERWNSWDAFRAPGQVVQDILHRLIPGHAPLLQVLFPWAIGAFFGMAYLVLWSQAADAAPAPAPAGRSDKPGLANGIPPGAPR